MTKVDYSCGCSYWFGRFVTWAAMGAAFGLSIAALESCQLLTGRVVYFDILEKDVNYEDYPIESGTRAPVPAPPDPFLDPQREQPFVDDTVTLWLGVYKYYDSEIGMCVKYDNEFSNSYLDTGAAEGAARFFGTFSAFLGGLALLLSFGLTGWSNKAAWLASRKRLIINVFAGLLIAAAIFQTFIFILNSSAHCGSGYWNEFLSERTTLLYTKSAVSCELGDGGWYAIIAFLLYLIAALLVITKWDNPAFDVFQMQWTKDYTGDPEWAFGNSNNKALQRSGGPEETRPLTAEPSETANDVMEQQAREDAMYMQRLQEEHRRQQQQQQQFTQRAIAMVENNNNKAHYDSGDNDNSPTVIRIDDNAAAAATTRDPPLARRSKPKRSSGSNGGPTVMNC